MNSELHGCHHVIAEIAQALREHPPAPLSQASYQHVSRCSRCRAGLLLLVRAFDSEPNVLASEISCDSCQADLAAYVDLEAEDPALAAATHPHVWWHLWTCQECAQTYEFTHMLLDAQHADQLVPLYLTGRTTQHTIRVFPHMRLTRQLLMAALPRRFPALSVLRGSDNRYVLFDEAKEEPER